MQKKEILQAMTKKIYLIIIAAWCLSPFVAAANPLISINPVHLEFTASPGDHLTGSFKFWNGTTAALPIHLEAADFKPQGEEGQILVDGEEDPANSLKSWVTPQVTDVTIAPGEEPTLDFSLDVPANADPGSHWGTLLAITGPQAVGPNTAINTRLGLLILVRVRGDEREKLTLESVSVPRFVDAPPIALEARFKNEGTVHEAPQGTIEVRNMFGSLVATGTLPVRNVLPGVVRKIGTAVGEGEGFWLGRYSVLLSATYGDKGEQLAAKRIIWVVPWRRYGMWALGILALFMWVIVAPDRFKRAWYEFKTGLPPPPR
jgi:hypothetical protein